ncbi:hypothetical protein D3C73_1199350 [compost metagenome]
MLRVKPQLADHLDAARPGLHAVELDPLLRVIAFHAVQPFQKIKVPPRPAEFAVSHHRQAELLLFGHRQTDLLILNRPQLSCVNIALLKLLASGFQRCRAQQTADNVSVKSVVAIAHIMTPGSR